ncbi:MAG: Fic family protein [Phycisphaerales bacterium]|nr:Fic family protein [Hyphomonadaceae bacterium]
MIVSEQHEPELYALVQERNLARQYDLLTNCVEIGLKQGPLSFDKYVLWALNHVAVANISQLGGRFREQPIYVGKHKPPHFKEVPDQMDRMISTIHEHWYTWSETALAAYCLWRMLWIHPFVEGNGRTARAACYYILCTKSGALLPGDKIVPERIRESRTPYYAALEAADRAWDQGHLDFSDLEAYLASLLQKQLSEA